MRELKGEEKASALEWIRTHYNVKVEEKEVTVLTNDGKDPHIIKLVDGEESRAFGTYMGDGKDRLITGLGFKPVAVMVKKEAEKSQ